MLLFAEVALVAWGALTFGAVYPWGYEPLAAAAAFVGALELATSRVRVLGLWRVLAALAAVAVVMAAQLVPLPKPLFAAVNPAGDAFLKRFDLAYPIVQSHSLTINPETTTIALVCFLGFTLLLLGTARAASEAGAARFVAAGITVFGLGLALFALAQNLALTNQTGEGRIVYIYGFWPDPYVNKPFGPFINKNNYAGWMLMATPLAVGYFLALLSRIWRSGHSDWRRQLLTLSTRDGAFALLSGVSALVMGASIIVSMSRSGMIALAATIVGIAWFAPLEIRRSRSRAFRMAVAGAALVVIVAAVGTDAIASRFEDRADASMAGRLIAWKNAVRIARDFPIAGTGFNTFGTAMLLYQQGDPINFWEEAHNDYLQVVVEGGIVGALIVAFAIGVVALNIRREFEEPGGSQTSYWIRFGAVAGLCAIAAQELVEFSLQIPGNAALFAALVGIALHRSPRTQAHR